MVLSRDLARFGLFGEAEIWSHDSLPNLICKNLGFNCPAASQAALPLDPARSQRRWRRGAAGGRTTSGGRGGRPALGGTAAGVGRWRARLALRQTGLHARHHRRQVAEVPTGCHMTQPDPLAQLRTVPLPGGGGGASVM